MGYDAGKEGLKTPCSSLVGEVIVDIVYQRKIDWLLMRSIETLIQYERLLNILMSGVAGCQLVIPPMTVHMKPHINRTEGNHLLVQRLQQQFLETTYQPKMGAHSEEACELTP